MKESVKRVSHRKGITLEEEYGKEKADLIKKKCSESRRGKTLSERHKENIRKSHLGKKNHFYGKSHTEEAKQKNRDKHLGISSWNKGTHLSGMIGRQHSEETKLKMSKAQKGKRMGEKSSNWQGGKSFEPYDKDFNRKFKRAIRKRDNQICMLCNIHREKVKFAFDIHHVDYNKMLSVPQNCISLCKSCHMKTGYNRKHWVGLFQNILSEKYGYQYSENEIVMELNNE